MNATTRVTQAGIKFEVGQEIVIPSYPRNIDYVLEDGEYVVLEGDDLSIYDVAQNWETAETMAFDHGATGTGYVLVKVTKKNGQEVMQYWRDQVADCWGFQN
jgi:hypothetical protein